MSPILNGSLGMGPTVIAFDVVTVKLKTVPAKDDPVGDAIVTAVMVAAVLVLPTVPPDVVYVAVVAADLLPAWSHEIAATVVVAVIVMVPPDARAVPAEQSSGAVTEVASAVT